MGKKSLQVSQLFYISNNIIMKVSVFYISCPVRGQGSRFNMRGLGRDSRQV